MIVGGYNTDDDSKLTSVEVIGDKKCPIDNLPYGISLQPQVILTNDSKILICGGSNENQQNCLVLLQNRTWVFHSQLIKIRYDAGAVAMNDRVYMLGGSKSPTTSEFLPTGKTKWQNGPNIPAPGFDYGCVVKKSDFEIILIGGSKLQKKSKIFLLDTNKSSWKTLGELREARFGHACAVINGKIVVSGGKIFGYEHLTSTELISLYDPSESKLIGHLNEFRAYHGLAVAHINSKLTLLAFGGEKYKNNGEFKYPQSIEQWIPGEGKWSILNGLKLSYKRYGFGYRSMPTRILCP